MANKGYRRLSKSGWRMASCRKERLRLANKNAIFLGAGQGPATGMRLLAEWRCDKNKEGTVPRCAFLRGQVRARRAAVANLGSGRGSVTGKVGENDGR